MSKDSRPRWFIRDVVPGDVAIGDPGPGDYPLRATVRVTATVINGCGGRSEIRFDAYAGFENHEHAGDIVGKLVKLGIEDARKAATAFCDTVNAEFYGSPTRGAIADVEALREEFAKGVVPPTWVAA